MVPVSNPAKRRNQMRPRLRFASGFDCHTCLSLGSSQAFRISTMSAWNPYASCLPWPHDLRLL